MSKNGGDRIDARIARLESDLRVAKRRKRDNERREKKAVRAIEARQKIIIGGTLLALARDDSRWEGRLQELYSHVPRERDRETLGLAPLEANTAGGGGLEPPRSSADETP